MTESFYYDSIYNEHSIFFSEKIFKPIVMKHPFILIGPAHSLKYLRSLGYKTFNFIIDEYYDEIDNDEKRLLYAVNEIERISKNEAWQWIEWQEKAKEIVEHNYQTLLNKISSKNYINK